MRVAALGNLGVSLLCRRGQVRAPATYTTRRRPLTAPRASLVTATVGVLLLALATNPGAGLLALALTGCGLAAVAPSSYGLIGRSVAGDQRGRAVSIATSIGYIGLLSGPVVVGLFSDRVGLRSTLAGLAIITLALCAVVLGFGTDFRESAISR